MFATSILGEPCERQNMSNLHRSYEFKGCRQRNRQVVRSLNLREICCPGQVLGQQVKPRAFAKFELPSVQKVIIEESEAPTPLISDRLKGLMKPVLSSREKRPR